MTGDISNFRWVKTNAPPASSRTDDVWFVDENVGWAVNSNGQILKTEDGFQSFVEQAKLGNYLRCVAFASADVGWVGTLDMEKENERLYHTTDGGANWNRVENLPQGAPERICGLSVVDENTVFASGTNNPDEPTAVVKTADGGETWTAIDLGTEAAILVDIHFRDRNEGWVVGGADVVKHPGRDPVRDDVIPVVLHTTDGGETWEDVVAPIRRQFPRGEWGWKIQVLDENTMFVALENERDGAILRSDDGGKTWRRLPINDRQRNANLEGIGFLDGDRGWVGGWGDLLFGRGSTSATSDGGLNWDNANEVGWKFINRFRFIGNPVRVGYACGDTVYKFTDQAPAPELRALVPETNATILEGRASVTIPFEVPEHTRELQIDVWERFGRHLRRLLDERPAEAGVRSIVWDFTDSTGEIAPVGGYIVRITADDESVSIIVYRR